MKSHLFLSISILKSWSALFNLHWNHLRQCSKSKIPRVFKWRAGGDMHLHLYMHLHLPASVLSGYLKPKHSQIHSCEIELCHPKANFPFILCGVCVWKICVYFSLFFIQIYHMKQKKCIFRPAIFIWSSCIIYLVIFWSYCNLYISSLLFQVSNKCFIHKCNKKCTKVEACISVNNARK